MSTRSAYGPKAKPQIPSGGTKSVQQADLIPVIEKLTNLLDVLARRLDKADN